jgi:hypothetical protein
VRARRNLRRRSGWVVGVLAALAWVGVVPALPASGASTRTSGSVAGEPSLTPRLQAAPHLPAGATAVGSLPSAQALTLTILMPSRDPAGLAAMATAISQPGDVQRGHYLTPAQFRTRFGAAPAAVAALSRRLEAEGLITVRTAADELSLEVTGTAGAVERAFGVDLQRQRISGRDYYANTDPARLPSGASAVLGLDNLARAVPEPRMTPATSHLQSDSCPAGGGGAYTPAEVASAYGFNSLYGNGLTGSGQTIASFELADYSDADISDYSTCFGGNTAGVSRILTDGGAPIGGGTSEATADVETLLGLDPGVSVLVYEGPDSAAGIYDNYAAIIDQDRASVIATSWGQCEPENSPGFEQAENALFQQAAVQGQSLVAASGDSGSEDCYVPGIDSDPELAVDDPAAQPYVTGVGGTSLQSVSPRSETVWNSRTSGGAGGGGISHVWPMPGYQQASRGPLSSGTSCGTGSGYCRQVPDVSGSADADHGYLFFCDAGDCAGAGWIPVGGTSLASPLWAAVVALSNQGCKAGPAGFLNPTLYAGADGRLGAQFTSALNDITAGNNDLLGNYSLYPAGAGYDMASGLGSPNAPVLAAELCAEAHAPPAPAGYRLVASDGGIFDYGAAAFYGSTGAERLNQPIVGMATTPDGRGYWLVASDGGIFTFGDARFFGSTGAEKLNQPIVGMATTPDGRGYWLVASDGGIFTFGDAIFRGSGSGRIGRTRVTGMAGDAATGGYWMVTTSGTILAFDAPNFAGAPVTAPVVGVAATPDDAGLRLAGSDGRIYAYGDATNLGSLGGTRLARPVVGLAESGDGAGYWLVASDGGIFSFGDAAFLGSAGAIHLAKPILGMASS